MHSLKPLPPKIPAYLSSIYSYGVTNPPPVQHYPSSTVSPPVKQYPSSSVAPLVQHYPSSTVGPLQSHVPHYSTSTPAPPLKFSILSPVPSLYPSSTVSPSNPSVPLHYHTVTSAGQVPLSNLSPDAPSYQSPSTDSSVIVSSLPPLPAYYQPVSPPVTSTPAPARYFPSSARPTISSTSAPYKVTSPSPSYFPSPTSPAAPVFLSSTQKPRASETHSSLLEDPIIQPSNRQEVAVFFAEKDKPKRKIGDVLKEFQHKTYKSLVQTDSFDSFSYQKHTTPSQSIKFVSEHSTTPSSVFIRSPTPKLVNPYERVGPLQHSWKDAEISINFKSQSSDLISPPKNSQRDKKSLRHHSIDYPNFNPPIYSEENFQPSVINRPVRFNQVLFNF